MGGEVALGVGAHPVVVDLDAPELLRALADVRNGGLVGLLLYQDRVVGGAEVHGRVVALLNTFGVGPEDFGQLADLLAGDLVGYNGDVEARHVGGEDLAVPVVDDAALGRVLDGKGARVLGHDVVLLAGEHLQVPQTGAEHGKDEGYEDGQREDAHLHVSLGKGRRLDPLLGRGRLPVFARR